ncbi:restriction endonuclease [Marivivens donghaensis]|uniref:Restriction endonuclease n=1 Tax=Marivivens donghaensis TaxID=1699413 RepID=A0ABX0W3M0_9RHOB|nr:restriction endonuclease [Marivivens donghaensis]NIY73982.1 restriction endonuclease [Marivivens donghaensis]
MPTITSSSSVYIEGELAKHVQVGEARATYNRYGEVTRIYIPVSHCALALFKEISGPDRYTLQEKLNELLVSWGKKHAAALAKAEREAGNDLALENTIEAERKISELEGLLKQTLDVDDKVRWDKLRTNKFHQPLEFDRSQPHELSKPQAPHLRLPAASPPRVSLMQKLMGKARAIEEKHRADYEAECSRARAEHAKRIEEYEANLKKRDEEHAVRLEAWRRDKDKWDKDQARLVEELDRELKEHNAAIDQLEADWATGAPSAVIEHASLVLDASNYPDWFQSSYRLDFTSEDRLLKVEFMLPEPTVVEIAKTTRFIPATGELKSTLISKAEQKRLYDSLCYQVALRTVHELFEADTPNNISAILFNGVVRHTDPATGREEDLTILSAVFEREKFLEVNLAAVDPKACFKAFKGVSAASLSGLAAIAPVIQFDTSDKRFIDGREIAVGVNEGVNVAAMNWDDFEHLVREIFEKEFASRGGEVKVTQSSSDGGVDAVAFDPDPITGGKIVIQAKRYTKTVGVSAVRDLYGTVMNEGASKGILVTTADYGPDAYKFAADKPITLLNGSNLLHLLSKHGINAQIDLKAARQELGYTA